MATSSQPNHNISTKRAEATVASPMASTFQASQGRECDKAHRNHRKGLQNLGELSESKEIMVDL